MRLCGLWQTVTAKANARPAITMKKLAARVGASGASGLSGAMIGATEAEATAFLNLSGPSVTQAPGGGEGGGGNEGGDGGGGGG